MIKKITLALLLNGAVWAVEAQDSGFFKRIDARAPGRRLDHFWSVCAGAGRANEGLRAGWLDELQQVHNACGFRYLRFHGLFHDDMFVYAEENGAPVFNWQYIDELYDRMLATGVRPFVELSFFPKAISSKATCFWWGAHGEPPANFDKWILLIKAYIHHCIARYGQAEVRRWYFEVWNEPNLNGFWNGTQAQYFEIYKETSLAIKGIDDSLKVGGPATSSYHPDQSVYDRLRTKKEITAADFIGVESHGPWIEDFLRYCEKENLPLDFVSSHPYPTTYPIDAAGDNLEMTRPVSSTREDIGWLRRTLEKTRYANAEIHLTEWSSSPSSRDYSHDYPQEAAFIVRANLQCIGLTQSLSYWTFTDVFEEAGAGPTIFHGGFGLVNFQGIVKPAFHAYRMLNALGDQALANWDGGIVTRDKTGAVTALFCYYPPEVIAAPPLSKGDPAIAEQTLNSGSPRRYTLEIAHVKPGALFTIEILDADHGWAIKEWRRMGSPEPPDRAQTAILRKAAMQTLSITRKADASGTLHFERLLQPWSVVLIKQITQ